MGSHDNLKFIHVGVLAIQGGFHEHEIALVKSSKLLGVDTRITKVTSCDHLQGLDGLVIPGGESTTVRVILGDKLLDKLINWAQDDKHVLFGTCAGLILLSKNIENRSIVDDRITKLGIMDITTSRNFFGRQLNSFESSIMIKDEAMLNENIKNNKSIPEICNGVFIRAPAIKSLDGPSVKTLATVQIPGQKREVIVGVQDKNCIGIAFHPELTDDLQWHTYFLKLVLERKSK